jgi:CubicO group peptidase (beta-lactamase class C family)
MKTNSSMKNGIVAGAAILLLATLAWFLIANLYDLEPPFMDYVPNGDSEVAKAEYWPTESWQTSTAEEEGFDSVKLAQGLQELMEKNYAIDSLLIIRNGRVILDAYFYPYKEPLPHDLASVTKSFTTTLIAIAASQGKLDLDQPAISYFPDRVVANLDERKKSMTVRDLAGMVNGMDSGCLSGDEPTLNTMRSQTDWVQAALDRKMTNEPGDQFCYDSPGMHLLSAILQEATGMTELEFARQNLFEPLGISDVYWESDPQGYTKGWGDLHLKPRDAAKLGYLWLHQGMWDGKQIVPADWVADAVKVHSNTGQTENYGYGWWVSKNGYAAIGRGQQNIRVYPRLNMIVVVTSADFDYERLGKMLDKALQDPEKPLPANPQGVARLNAQIAELAKGPGSEPATSLPKTAQQISGKTYLCESNVAGVTSIHFEFNDLKVANITIKQNNSDVVMRVGLDGQYRVSTNGQGAQGKWKDEQTFLIYIFDIGQFTRELQFKEDQLLLTAPEADLTITCRMQNPE